jgi:CheY-like chemotaxis protein
MPMMSGYDAAHMISKEAPDIPIMFLSCRDLRHQVQKGFDSGPTVVDYLVKNTIQPDQLVQRVDQILELAHDLGLEAVRQSAARTRGLEAVRQ